VVSLALMAVSAGASAEPEGGGAVAVNAVERMEAALQRYRLIAERGGWPRVGEGPKLAPGDIGARVAALRQRLAATGDWQSAAVTGAASRYDQALEEAVTAFQRRHGLEADGVVGARTRRALDVPASQRVARIAANLRRIRARPLGDRDTVVQVNIPDFRVSVYEDGRATFATRAIVGRPEHATPSLETHIEAVILNPAWNVPRAIVREDLAELFARKDGYAERNGFHAANSERPLAAFDWDDKPMVPVRQAPGPSNALGRIKFHMPNDRAIYLHDTPKKHLFDQRPRAFSAGCVRVERPMALAARLTGLERDRLAEMAAGGETRSLRFGWRIPVQLVYFTAWVDTRGRVQFRRDIYDRDERALAEAR
jgi:murein L,D-transpeptidase YcbB/YkuD